jgi:hypothetical protein
MPGLGLFRRLTGRAASEGAAFAIGTAVGPGLRPIVREVENAAWSRFRFWPLDPRSTAEAVAEGHWTHDQGDTEAAKSGLSSEAWEALLYAMRNAPGIPEALYLWRRGLITEAMFDHALTKARLEPEFHAAIKATKTAPLDPEIVSAAIQRGIMHDPGFLPVAPPTGGGRVPAFPVSDLDALVEAAAGGMDRERLFVETALRGNPMGPHESAQAVFRGIIDRADFDRAIAEGNTRNEWRDAIFDQSRQIPTAHEYVELHLRNYIDVAGMNEGTARHGMSAADTDVLFKAAGRPLSFHQVFIGTRRGGSLGGPIGDIDPAFIDSLRKSNIRPEYYNLAWAQRYVYPTTFALRGLTQSGAITEAEAEQVLLYEGWEPTFAKRVATFWAGGTGTTPTTDPLVKKAQSQLWTATHRSYVVSDASESEARTRLAELGATGAAQDTIIGLWNAERTLVRADLSRSDVRKEYEATRITEAEAITRLEQLGYSQAEATAYLHIT